MQKKYLTIVALFLVVASCEPPYNGPPHDVELTYITNEIIGGETIKFTCQATDDEADKLSYNWHATGGSFNNTSSSSIIWYSPINNKTEEPLYEFYQVFCDVTDAANPDKPQSAVSMIFTFPLNHCEVDGTGSVLIANIMDITIQVNIKSNKYTGNVRTIPPKEYTTYIAIPPGDITIMKKTTGDWISYEKHIEQCEKLGFSISQ
jgi:hypothetical protein